MPHVILKITGFGKKMKNNGISLLHHDIPLCNVSNFEGIH
jgi:hypothetical protein